MKKTKKSARVQEHRQRRRIAIAAVAVVTFLGVVLTAQLTKRQPPAATPVTSASTNGARTAEYGFVRREPGDPMAVGDVNAPVVLVQWTDMRCPFCAVFSRDTLPVLLREYVQTGKVRLEVHDVAYFGEQSEQAAVAARAAAQQGRFFDFLHAVYEKAPERGHPDLPREKLIAFAEKAGVPDIARFTTALDDPDLRSAAEASNTDAGQWGVTSVPFFVAGDSALSGAQPTAVFRRYLDDAIAAAS